MVGTFRIFYYGTLPRLPRSALGLKGLGLSRHFIQLFEGKFLAYITALLQHFEQGPFHLRVEFSLVR